MIKLDNRKIILEQFGDGTLKMESEHLIDRKESRFTITWTYDNDGELFALMTLVDQIRSICGKYTPIVLELPYIPNARQDRVVDGRAFTLKTFANVINSLDFSVVKVLDPHSDVSLALFNNLSLLPDFEEIVLCDMMIKEYDAVMFPDNGAAKKYSAKHHYSIPIIVGNKHRENGKIVSYEILDMPDNIKSVIIRDDICSYGGTFVAAAKALKERGVEHIDLLLSHCENNILKGEVFNYVDTVFTTDSIYTEASQLNDETSKVRLLKIFRDYED